MRERDETVSMAARALTLSGGTVVMALLTLTLWTWRHASKLDDADHERIKQLESHEWEQVVDALADLFREIRRVLRTGSDPDSEGERERVERDRVEAAIDRELEYERLESLVASHQALGRSRRLYADHRDRYEDAYTYFGYATIAATATLLVGTWSFGREPLGFDPQLVVAVLGLGTTVSVLWGLRSFRRARKLKSTFDERWTEYEFEY
jgi:hypothetical protein